MRPRTATLVIARSSGELLGQLGPLVLEEPWWQEVGELVRVAAEQLGCPVVVSRLVTAEQTSLPGGGVVYLGEVKDNPPRVLSPLGSALARACGQSDPRRAAWAKFGGHEPSLTWVRRVWPSAKELEARQRRTWNLSSLWEFGGAASTEHLWLKQVPPFLAHEAVVLRWVGENLPGFAPQLLAQGDEGRLLLQHVAGEDCYDAPASQRASFAKRHHQVQVMGSRCCETLVARGVPDLRGARLGAWLNRCLAEHCSSFPRVARLLLNIDAHLEQLAACGVPDTLVHGDLHPGNVRCLAGASTILDWGDSFIGNPVFDLLRLCEGVSDGEAASLTAQWCARWRDDCGAQPELAVEITKPLVPLRLAATYAHFVENIEPSEQPYHVADIRLQLELAEALLAAP